jgi:hypothetical protein
MDSEVNIILHITKFLLIALSKHVQNDSDIISSYLGKETEMGERNRIILTLNPEVCKLF